MNELEFLRQQLGTEEQHLAAVAGACAAALAGELDPPPAPEFLESCATYLLRAGARSVERDQAQALLLRATLGGDAGSDAGGDPASTRALLADLESGAAAGRAALARLETALGAAQATERGRETGTAAEGRDVAGAGTGAPPRATSTATALRAFLAQQASLPAARRRSLEQLSERHFGIAEWRRAAQVDADTILEERDLWARVAQCLPEGLSLAPAESPWMSSPNPRSTR